MNQVYRDVEQHIPHLRRYAWALTHNQVAAQDLVQESLTRALAKSSQFERGTNLRAWLFTILHNQFISGMRRQVRIGPVVDPEDAAKSLATRPNQEGRLVIKALEKALRSLPAAQRRLITMVALDGVSYEDAAALFDVPIGTVKSRVSRGRTALRASLEGESVFDGVDAPAVSSGRAPANSGSGPSFRTSGRTASSAAA